MRNPYGLRPTPCAPDCANREAHCHAACDKYKEWAAERDVKRAEYNEARAAERRISDYFAETGIKLYERLKR